MDKNCFNYLDFDETEMKEDEEKQRKEIQALLATEFYNLEIEDDNEDNCNIEDSSEEENDDSSIDSTSQNDKENVLSCPRFPIQHQDTPCLSHPMTAFYPAPQTHNLINYQHIQTNNNYHAEEVPINWEISLHGEMGPSAMAVNSHFLDKISYMATSSVTVKEPFFASNIISETSTKALSSPIKILKRDVAVECVPVNQRELDNLELLYTARGRRIEQLQIELDTEKDKRLKETRILNHKVTLLESEQKNESNLLKSYKIEIDEQRQNIIDKDKTIEVQFQKLRENENLIEELKNIVDVRGGLVESLNTQLAELNCHSTMARNNKKQSELLDCINLQFDTDSQRLQKEILRLSERIDEKTKEIETMQVQFEEQINVHQSQKRIWAEEKQKINDKLDEEKMSRQKLEDSLSQQKVIQLQNQMIEVTMAKSMVEDINFYLQEEVSELTNQLLVYEQSISMMDIKHTEMKMKGFMSGGRSFSCPSLPDKEEDKLHSLDKSDILRKEVFSLMNRTHSLTNRLIDVRKDNLDAKRSIKKLQHTIVEQNELLFALEEKFAKAETRLGQLQSGGETDVEKQLRNSYKSLEMIKDSLEVQCKSLQSQLKQANETLEDMEKLHHQRGKEFDDFKNMLEQDKDESIEEVKRACNNHYDNLREQLEISWKMEKEMLLLEERKLREQLQNDLSETTKEIHRVKNQYIELSQQKSDEQSDLNNWNEWLAKKLEDQKRSLNQQFQNDYHMKISELISQYEFRIEELRSKLQNKVIKEDKETNIEFIFTDTEVQCDIEMSSICCQNDIDIREISVQTIETLQELNDLDDLRMYNTRLKSTVNDLMSQIEHGRESHIDPTSNVVPTFQKINHDNTLFPRVIRSSTPQMIHSSNFTKDNRNNNKNGDLSGKNFHTLFQSLKDDLVGQLTELSRVMVDKDIKKSSQTLNCSIKPLDSVDRIKEQLYNYILQIQSRAASTLREQLHSTLSLMRRDLLRQLQQILPLTLSVDGEMIKISPDKMKVLIDKVTLILDRFQSDDNVLGYVPSQPFKGSFDSRQSNSVNFSATSTPKMSQMKPREIESDVTSICSDDSYMLSPLKKNHISPISPSTLFKSTVISDNIIRTRREQLQDEITQLSLDLLKTKNVSRSDSVQKSSLFSDVDQNWLCPDLPININ